MLTLNSLIRHFEDCNKLQYEGKHYVNGQDVYSGDLWRLWPDPDGRGLESKNQDRLRSLMERKGMQLRFYDEIISDEQGRAHESQHGYYGDVGTYQVFDDGSIWARDEAEENQAAYLEYFVNNITTANKWEIDLTEHGYERFDYDAESGWHRGQDDRPQGVLEKLEVMKGLKAETDFDYIFQIDYIGQFDLGYSLWYKLHEKEEDKGGE